MHYPLSDIPYPSPLGCVAENCGQREAAIGCNSFALNELPTRPAGLEPATFGFEVRDRENITADKTKTCEPPKEQLTPKLTPKSQQQSKIDVANLPVDLAEIVFVWLELPEHIKAAIKALIRTA